MLCKLCVEIKWLNLLLILVIKSSILQMKPSNNTLEFQKEHSNKYADFYKHRKNSCQINLNRKIFQNLDSFAKEDEAVDKKLNIGKIRRNSTNNMDVSSKKTINSQNNYQRYMAVNKLLAKQLNMIPLKESNMINPQTNTPKQQIQDAQAEIKMKFKRNVRSISSHFQIQYQNLIKQYEKKKQTINHQIESFKNAEKNKLKTKKDPPKIDLFINTQTPKFGNNILLNKKVPSIKSIKPVSSSKVAKQTKWATFVKAIKVQMELQQKLRNFKHQISSEHKQSIKKILKTKYAIQENIVEIDTQEFDPYIQKQNLSIQVISSQLANSFLCSQQNWNKNIKNSFDSTLINDIFTSFQTAKQKGLIPLKGFVRQMGIVLQNQRYLRNRDLYRIYKRIEPFTKDNFISILGKRQ